MSGSPMGILEYLTGQQQSTNTQNATNASTAIQAGAQDQTWAMYNQNRQDQMPYIQAGQTAINRLGTMTSPGGSLDRPDYSTAKYEQDPYYKWMAQQGLDAITAKSNAAGNLGSGNLGTALSDYAQQEAGAGYSDWYNRQVQEDTNQYNRLMGIVNPAQTATQQVGAQGGAAAGLGVSSAANIGSTLMGGANAQNYLYQMMSQRMGQGQSNAANQIMGAVGAYQRNNAYQNQLNDQSWNDWSSGSGNGSYMYNGIDVAGAF